MNLAQALKHSPDYGLPSKRSHLQPEAMASRIMTGVVSIVSVYRLPATGVLAAIFPPDTAFSWD